MSVPLRPGDPHRVGPYRLHGRLGGGGMGRVYLGRSPGGHTVAVKVVHPDLADDTGFRNRFADEVEAARRVGGFYTAQVIDADTNAERPWLATAYIPGPSLYEAVEEHEPLPPDSVAALGAGLAEGLVAIHACNLVHRDLKPANVILAADGPRVIDFGIARALDTTSHTRTRTVLGTAGFMAPEQARTEKTTPATDVFALGCVLAYAATGRSPFGAGRADEVVYRVVHEKPDLSGVPASLSHLVSSCLAKEPERRPTLDRILTQLTRLAGPGSDRTDGQWLPSAITEVITHRTTAVLTLPPTRRTPIAPRPSTRGGKVPDKAKAPTPTKATAPAAGKPPTRPSTAAPSSASSGSSNTTTETKQNDDEDTTGWWVAGIAAAVIAGLLYLNHYGFSLWVSEELNAGTDNLAVDDCLAYVGSQDEPAEVPCFAAAAEYTVVGLEISNFSDSADLRHECEGVGGWTEGADHEEQIGVYTACLIRTQES